MAYQFNPFTGNFDSVGQSISALNVKGSVADVASLPAGATTGDVYLVQADAHFYVWDGAGWDDLGTLQGPAGPAGADGANGANGADGANGVDGKTILSGAGAPSSGLGSDGDFYLDTSATAIYGPKTSGSWGSPTSLIGPQGPTGAQGSPGPAGADGAAGANGDSAYDVAVSNGFVGTESQWLASLVGAQGPQGDPGPTGPQGAGLALQGTVPTVGDLPGSSTVGYGYIVVATGDLYVWNGSSWVNAGPIQGPQGDAGPTGPAGANGADGADGKTILSGTGAPGSGLGVDGDFYIDTAASEIYGPKTAGAWGSGTSLIGPQGPAGANGADGANGSNGADGKTILNGTGAPGSGLGVDGDFYIDTAANEIYGPKTAGAWGSGTSLVGPTGATGPAGANGADGADGVGVPVGGTTGQVLTKSSGTDYDASWQTLTVSDVFIIACSDETTALTDGVNKARFTMPYAGTLTAVKADVNTAPTGSALVVDINESGASILSTKLSIDINETSSTTAATPAVISDSALANRAVISIDIDQKGSTVAGAGLKVTLYVTRS